MHEHALPHDVVDVTKELAEKLIAAGQAYAFGGAIAFGYWGRPRATQDVDLTLFLPAGKPSECLWILQDLGCDVSASEAVHSLTEHAFCRTEYHGIRVDVFLPSIPFYEAAKARMCNVELEGQSITIWDAASLCVFKMMFFREQDLVDVRQLLRVQADALERSWVRKHLVEIYGQRDPRIVRWDELARDNPVDC